jgi:Big-like domain-containing protein
LKTALRVAIVILALASFSYASITISSPTAGTSVGSPVHIVASATSSNPIVAMKVYVDSTLKYSVSAAKIDTSIAMSAGSHYVVVQSWDSKGTVQKQPMTITVTSTSSGDGSGTTIPSNATYYSNIDQMTGWESCDSCAGPGGAGPSAPYSMTQNQSSPSLDGRAVEFFLGGSTPYSAALWWKQLGGNSAVRNFVYDLYFYVKNPSASQALEFDVNQSLGGQKFIFGTQCDYKNHKDWDVWDTAGRAWIKTGIPCTPPQAYTWNHLVLEFQRTTGGKASFIAVTLNGKKSYINRSYYPKSSGVNELNAAFQMDGNGSMTDYSVWLDKVRLIAW